MIDLKLKSGAQGCAHGFKESVKFSAPAVTLAFD